MSSSSAEPALVSQSTGPVGAAERIESLDVIRGVAILGILPMNSLAFGLDVAAYYNVSADGVSQPLDWVIGILTVIFVDQKMMALFSMLFGVGVVVFAERAAAKGRRTVWLSLWRFALLLVVGIIHASFWFGDILVIYAVCAPLVLLVRRFPAWLLGATGVALSLVGTLLAPWAQSNAGTSATDLGPFWFAGYEITEPTNAATWLLVNALGRAIGFMLIGVVLYRLGIVQGKLDGAYYRRLAVWGISIGAVVTAAGPAWHVATDWSADHAIVGTIPTGLGTIPMALGYLAAVILLSRRRHWIVDRLRKAGRMALTNYLTQTVLGLVTLGWFLDDVDLTRTMILVWILGVWLLQLWWSTWWLRRFRFGPFEWAWRCATYRSRQPLRV